VNQRGCETRDWQRRGSLAAALHAWADRRPFTQRGERQRHLAHLLAHVLRVVRP
jgi:hypothetical protein